MTATETETKATPAERVKWLLRFAFSKPVRSMTLLSLYRDESTREHLRAQLDPSEFKLVEQAA